jgi:hypothetical protein
MGQLKAMIPYFQDPAKWRLATQMHSAHERSLLCSALTTLQIQADGGVTTCAMQPVIGNLLEKPIRELWESRPQWWVQDCCLERRS